VSTECLWQMSCSDPSFVPVLTFSGTFDVGNDGTSYRLEDVLYIYDGSAATNPSNALSALSGVQTPDPITGPSAALTAQLVYNDYNDYENGAGFDASFQCVDMCEIARAYYCLVEVACTAVGGLWAGECTAPCGAHNVRGCLTEEACVGASSVWVEGKCGDPCEGGVQLQDSGTVSTFGEYRAGDQCRWTLSCSSSNSVPRVSFTR